ncbi:MAG: hypothetical protein A2152_01650 [Candidatus Levybacteria bacterium RBG_16_35_6]|nr:MAG: hypothetical protein A2152_01650 [Candidatus Levybacteria bacterium RBG_16_35_6]
MFILNLSSSTLKTSLKRLIKTLINLGSVLESIKSFLFPSPQYKQQMINVFSLNVKSLNILLASSKAFFSF